jgi:hypothetical protein
LPSPSGQLTKIGCQPIKGWFNLGRQRLTKDLAMLRFGRAPMACSPALQTGNEVIIKITHMQISGHLSSVRPLRSMMSPGLDTVNGEWGQQTERNLASLRIRYRA